LREFWFYFRPKSVALSIGLYIFAVFAFLALFGPLVAPFMTQPSNFRAAHPTGPPAGRRGGQLGNHIGTDPLGRDMLSALDRGRALFFLCGVVVRLHRASGGIIHRADRGLCA